MIDYDSIAGHVVTDEISDLPIPEAAVCIWSGKRDVERHATEFWESRQAILPDRTHLIVQQNRLEATIRTHGKDRCVSLLDNRSLRILFSESNEVVIDVTAIRTGVWAPLMMAARKEGISVKLVYVEADGYAHKPDPVSWNWYELTSRTQGFGPIPGLGKLASASAMEESVLVIFLGFEGVRARRAMAEFDPSPHIVPVVALPGRKLHFSHVAVASNSNMFNSNVKIISVRYAGASDPFEAQAALNQIRSAYLSHFIHIAAVGTKPHQIGAVLFRLNDSNSDLMYDFPEPRHSAAIGVGRAHLYHINFGDCSESDID